jgi:predicted glycosyltransferase
MANVSRILIYSHDTMGLGHTRRNQAIACGLARSLESPTILMACGARQATLFDVPACVDYVTIPALRKSPQGEYLPQNTGLSLADTVALRSNILRTVVRDFRPDLLIVDKVPCGVCGELRPVLEELRQQRHTRCVLGLRDILDDPDAVRREWAREGNEQAIEDYYDAVWVYGDRRIYDLGDEYGLRSSTASKLNYLGYLDRGSLDSQCQSHRDADGGAPWVGQGKLALCLVGGGQDGAQLAVAFAGAELPADTFGVIVTGPYMAADDRQQLESCAQRNPRLRLVDFVKQPEQLLAQADRVVAMGGYNTVCEIVSQGKTALIVPRTIPRCEQLIRAQRFRDLGLVDMLHPESLDAHSLSTWLHRPAARLHDACRRIDFGGISRLPTLVTKLFDDSLSSMTHHAWTSMAATCEGIA